MNRVTFLLETGERLGCLLNPESLSIRRLAGIRPRQSLGGGLTGVGLADDVLLQTGGGTTELQLELLFDVTIAGSSISTEDVRDLTAPLWELAENRVGQEGRLQSPVVRFVWGKSWNIPGVIVAVSERLEFFTPGGTPQRSWLRMRMLRVLSPQGQQPTALSSQSLSSQALRVVNSGTSFATDQVQNYEVVGQGDRPDAIAARYYNSPSLWRIILSYNNIDDPLHLAAGTQLQIPPRSALEGQ
jgi:hypothetical protein